MTAAASDAGASRIDVHWAEFNRLVGRSRKSMQRGNIEAAAAWAQVAATYAWMQPVGLFASLEIEETLLEVGRALPTFRQIRTRTADPRRVLHVLTQAYPTGGSTQFVASWMRQDAHREHRVVLTHQGTAAVPDKLTEQVPSSHVSCLDGSPGGFARRAGRLRELASHADIVLVHTHPYDVLPTIAFANPPGPPVAYVNHADHVFWIGVATASLLINMRHSGEALALARRGVAADRSVVMPRPLRPGGRTMDRETAKRRLGLPVDAHLVTTIADGSKYRLIDGPSLLQSILPQILDNPSSYLLAAGPDPVGEWADAQVASGGRVRALGRLMDVTTLHEAADVYLDSFPFASLTSLLEAGVLGTPVVTYSPRPAQCAVLGSDTPGIDAHLLRPTDPEMLRSVLDDLLQHPAERAAIGHRMRQAIEATHTGDGWTSRLDNLYRLAERAQAPLTGPATTREVDLLDEMIDLVMSRTGYSMGVVGALRSSIGLFPFVDRARASVGLRLGGRAQDRLRQILPHWTVVRLARLRRVVMKRPSA